MKYSSSQSHLPFEVVRTLVSVTGSSEMVRARKQAQVFLFGVVLWVELQAHKKIFGIPLLLPKKVDSLVNRLFIEVTAVT